MVGILVHGDNHLILRGPMPDPQAALAFVRGWALTTIGSAPPGSQRWQVVTREFRENLQWAVVVGGETETSPAVKKLLEELSARGIAIHVYQPGSQPCRANVKKERTMNEWYRLVFTADDISAAKHLEVEGHFEKFFLAAGSPEDATLFRGREPGQTIYYFSPGAARIASKLITHVSAVTCPAPAMSEVVFIAGHQPSGISSPERGEG